jgi:transcription elongation factor GreA
LEGRISEVEGKLANSQIIDVTKLPKNGRVVFGTTVNLINVATEEKVSYKIVGDDEADIKQSMISVNSPIARAMIGKNEGDIVVVVTPNGEVEYEVDKVNYIA